MVTQSAIEFRYDCVAGRLAKVESLTEFPFGAGDFQRCFSYNHIMSMASYRLQENNDPGVNCFAANLGHGRWLLILRRWLGHFGLLATPLLEHKPNRLHWLQRSKIKPYFGWNERSAEDCYYSNQHALLVLCYLVMINSPPARALTAFHPFRRQQYDLLCFERGFLGCVNVA